MLLAITAQQATGQIIDSGNIIIPEISYHSLDSMITTSPLTAVYFWPTWCAPCVKKLPEIIDLLSTKKSISLLMINDPDSKKVISKSLIKNSEVIKGIYRIEPVKPVGASFRRMIQVNDVEQIRQFNRHFTKQTNRKENERSPAFFLFDHDGKLLYVNKTLLDIDSIKAALTIY